MSPDWLDSLKRRIDEVRRATGSESVDLVGISQGGVIGLWYLNNFYKAEACGNFSPPGHPTRELGLHWSGMPLLGAVSKGLRQLIPNGTVYRGPYPSTTTGRKGLYLGHYG